MGRTSLAIAGRLGLIAALSAFAVAFVAAPAPAATGDITTFAGTGSPTPFVAMGAATSVNLSSPHGITYDANPAPDPYAGDVFVSDTNNCAVRVVDPAGNLTALVNTSGLPCGPITAGPASASSLNHPHGLSYDSVNHWLYIADRDNHEIEKVDLNPAVPTIATLTASSTALTGPVGLVVDQTTGDLYIADELSSVVWRAPFGGGLQDVAGTPGTSGFNGNGGSAASALLNQPSGLDYDPATATLYIADALNNEIRSVNAGIIHRVLGSKTAAAGFSPDGTLAASVLLTAPRAVRFDSAKQIFFDDTGNNLVRTIDAAGAIRTIAGGGTVVPGDGGPATQAMLDSPHALIVVPSGGSGSGDLIFSDTNHHRVRRLENVAVAAVTNPGATVPELPWAVLLPVVALVVVVLATRRRRDLSPQRS